MTYATPSEAVRHGACPMCLGDGRTYKALDPANVLTPCSGCGGSGTLADLMARQCDDPDCVEHHHRRDAAQERTDLP